MKKFLFVFFLIVIGFLLFFHGKKDISVLLNDVDSFVHVDKYYIYGNHMNISGSIDTDIYDSINLVLKGFNSELSYDINYDSGKVFLSSLINEGICLDDIPIGKYIVFIKVTNGDLIKYYSLINDTSYNDISYYTTTKNGKNNLININFSSVDGKDYMFIDVKSSVLPDNYYDVVIDAGHGGEDSGAVFSKYTESNLNLDFAISLKSALDGIGLKTILTRVDDTYPSAYGANSRTGIAYETLAKYFISIHLNSSDAKMKYGGVEVYAANNSNLDFADMLASNIVDCADTTFSKNESFNVSKGVYVRTFSKNDIASSIDDAKKYGYNPYPITTDTNYYFMIRETGGIATGAYIDGRSSKTGKNNYYNSNIGAEGYLLELGYINYWPDLNNLIDNKDGYIDGIVKSFNWKINKAG